jgi:hypothetical protein
MSELTGASETFDEVIPARPGWAAVEGTPVVAWAIRTTRWINAIQESCSSTSLKPVLSTGAVVAMQDVHQCPLEGPCRVTMAWEQGQMREHDARELAEVEALAAADAERAAATRTVVSGGQL